MRKRIPTYLVIFVVLAIFAILRIHTFYLPHNNTDELIYVSLASKLENFGLRAFKGEYNLYNLDLLKKDFSLGIFPSKERFGSLTSLIVDPVKRVEYLSLSHHPPLFCSFLILSHKLFSPHQPYMLNWENSRMKGIHYQLYACIIPFLFSLFLVFSIYILGKILFSKDIGTLAALLMVFTPIDMLTSQKIWPDDLMAFIIAFSVILYILALKKGNVLIASLAGISAGLGFLTKPSGLLTIFIIIFIHGIFQQSKNSSFLKGLFDKNIISFFFCFLIIILPWVVVFISENGAYSFFAQYSLQTCKIQNLPTAFIRFVSSRPWYAYLVTTPFQQPIFWLGYGSIFYFLRDKANKKNLVILIFWFLLFLVLATLRQDKEERYMLPAYPAITILSSYVFLKLRSSFANSPGFKFKLWNTALICLLILSLALGAEIGLSCVFARSCLIPIPV